ncbi:MAG TPA: ABC transporter C-terminal domain-containing protein, partial [Desulfuromonadaceae bacterium]
EERLRDREEQKRQKREEQARGKKLGEIEAEIGRTEKEIARLEGEMNSPGFFDDPGRGAEAGERHAALNARLEELYREWEGLSG